jgi:hypothetical protein
MTRAPWLTAIICFGKSGQRPWLEVGAALADQQVTGATWLTTEILRGLDVQAFIELREMSRAARFFTVICFDLWDGRLLEAQAFVEHREVPWAEGLLAVIGL